jgi:hypothetical protein
MTANTFLRPHHPDLKADFVLANPTFNVSDCPRSTERVRWKLFEKTQHRKRREHVSVNCSLPV